MYDFFMTLQYISSVDKELIYWRIVRKNERQEIETKNQTLHRNEISLVS
jgi:hypothetical protein